MDEINDNVSRLVPLVTLAATALLAAAACSSGGGSGSHLAREYMDDSWSASTAEERVEACLGLNMFDESVLIDLIDSERETSTYEQRLADATEEQPELIASYSESQLHELDRQLTGEFVVEFLQREC